MLSTLESFEDCVATLSAIEDWNSDQLDALVTLAKAVSEPSKVRSNGTFYI